MRIAELARRVGVAPSAVRWYEQVGVLPAPDRRENGYRAYADGDVARLRLVVALRRLGLGPTDAGRLARLCLEQGAVDLDLGPLLAEQRAVIARQRDDLDRLEGELIDLELTIAAASRARRIAAVPDPIRVLFVCTHNSARSQIAEALLGRYGGAAFEVHSAGTEATRVNPFAIRVLAELDIDWSNARSKVIDEFLDQHFDYVVTVCDRAREACPVFPGSENTLHWGLDDPSAVEGTDEERLAAFRRTAQELSARLRPFIEIALRAAGRAPEGHGHRVIAGPSRCARSVRSGRGTR
jgi:arsenate reductase